MQPPPLPDSALQNKLESAIAAFHTMPHPDQLRKLETILHVYAAGNEHLVEGLKLTYMALISVHARLRELDTIQQTLGLINAPQIAAQFLALDQDLEALTILIFPNDRVMAVELIKEEYTCEQQ